MLVSVNTITGAVRQCEPDFQGDGIWGSAMEVAPVTSCDWHDNGDYWESACGNAWVFTEGGLKENNMVFCNKCGGKIIEKLDR